MADQLDELLRMREQVAKLLAHGDLTNDTRNAMQETLASIDRDIATAKVKQIH